MILRRIFGKWVMRIECGKWISASCSMLDFGISSIEYLSFATTCLKFLGKLAVLKG
jgi:hypothetical protein